jgi:hypothetical protein
VTSVILRCVTKNPEWLVLVHHLPPRPTRLRVRVWRQLQKLGAVAVKNSVYVLPWSEKTLEDFTWLQQEIAAGGGEAVLFRANAVAGTTDSEIIATFRSDRDTAYVRLAADLLELVRRIRGGRSAGRLAPEEIEAIEREVDAMQNMMNDIDEIDFFKATGRARAAAAMKRAREQLRTAHGRRTESTGRDGAVPPGSSRADYQGRLWVTRPRPHIDRCASAWLIRRFIDRRPRFGFVAEGGKLRGGIPYDMAGAAFGHQGEECTFETMVKQFGLGRDPALRAMAEIVHDIDLKDSKFGRAESTGVNAVLRGLAEGVRDDHRLLRESEAVFDGLYAALAGRPARGGKNVRSRKG